MHEAHGTEERMNGPLVLHCCVVAGEQAGLMAESVASDAGGEGGGITVQSSCLQVRWLAGVSGAEGVTGYLPSEGVAAHEVVARGRLSPPKPEDSNGLENANRQHLRGKSALITAQSAVNDCVCGESEA